jgi:hypothetical protein
VTESDETLYEKPAEGLMNGDISVGQVEKRALG